MKHTRNQHYVPRLYLRQFAAERRVKNPPIYTFDKSSGAVHRPSIRNVAAELHFYERGNQGIEKWFTDVEDAFVDPYRRLLQMQSFEELSEQDVAAIVLFLAAQFVRTREHRAHLKAIAVAVRDWLDKEGGDYDPEWADVSDDTLRVQHVAMLPGLIQRCSEIMVQMKPILLVNGSSVPLWTSDHPITVHNGLTDGVRGNLGLACRGVEVHFPLSPTRSLCLCDPLTFDGLPDIFESVDVNHVRFLNSLQVVTSTRLVFSNTSDFAVAREIVREHPHYADPARPRVRTN